MRRLHAEDTGPGRGPGPDRPGPAHDLLRLQATAGNRVATRHVQRLAVSRAAPLGQHAVVHENRQVTEDFRQVQGQLEAMIAEKGWRQTRSWAYRFINADPLTDLRYGGDLPLVARVRERLRVEVTMKENEIRGLTGSPTLDLGDVVLGGGRFEPAAMSTTTELLNRSEQQLKSEMTHYGLKVDGWVFKDYSMAGGPAQTGLKDAARRLAGQRKTCDDATRAFFAAQKAAEADARQWGPLIPARPALLAAQEEARKAWVAQEDAYHDACTKEQITYPVLAAYSTLDHAAAELRKVADADSAALAESLYKTIDDRVKNIATVRASFGDRFNPWKQPQIVALTKKQLGLNPWQCKVVDERAADVKADAELDAKVFAAVAIGLGLLAAIPTGGTSVLAGVAAASAGVGAAYSAYNLYEHYKDYQLASAETGTALDKAQAVSQDEPGLMWLAFDLLDLGLNVVGAAAAFKTLRGAMAAAEASQLGKLPELIAASGRAGLPLGSRSKLIATVLERLGGSRSVEKALQSILDAFAAARPDRDAALVEAMGEAAAKLVNEQKVAVFFPGKKASSIKEIKRVLEGAGVNSGLNAQAEQIYQAFNSGGFHGHYFQAGDKGFVLLRDGETMASSLAHEMAHRGQHLRGELTSLGTMRSEYQAYHAQREFLLALPDELVPAQHARIRNATDADLVKWLTESREYGPAIRAEASSTGVMDPAVEARSIEKWFLTGG
ncbi:hypothetical protein Lfu02_44550 [Longispora fulva]|uniref:Uncharacterized protein n=1 Tax=Longispora fulva TaxID=619741 RepID=A0A8J7GJP2_9ACTN|nr:hypothetical protein [Longispora fulva]MBG6137828.1 hypothetical protein [Longispora fulva]GIG60083.1 hypothetical protein Lfu02_44550 [Longispora fulva]